MLRLLRAFAYNFDINALKCLHKMNKWIYWVINDIYIFYSWVSIRYWFMDILQLCNGDKIILIYSCSKYCINNLKWIKLILMNFSVKYYFYYVDINETLFSEKIIIFGKIINLSTRFYSK